MPRRDLSLAEQANVRALMHLLRVKLGDSWTTVERALPLSHSIRAEITKRKREVSVTVAYRVAKALDVSLHHVLTGTALPPGTCRHCGRSNEE